MLKRATCGRIATRLALTLLAPGSGSVVCVVAAGAAALASAACVKVVTNVPSTTATPPPAPTSILAWAGSARSSRTTTNGFTTTSFEGTVTWQKVENPDPAVAPVLAGTVLYTISGGLLHVAVRKVGVICSEEGAVDVALGPNAPLNLFRESYIYVGQDGQYAGDLYAFDVPVAIAFSCSTGEIGSDHYEVRVSLSIKGRVTAAGRIQGEMVPETVLGSTTTGSWDFAPR